MKLAHRVTLAIHGFCEGPGIELEGPIDFPEIGTIRPGLATDQVQICSSPTRETTTLLDNFVTLGDVLYKRCLGVPLYRPSRRNGVKRELRAIRWEHPHTQSLIKPLYAPDEFAVEASQLVRLADYGFSSVDFDVSEYTPEAQLLRLNLLNLVGPGVLDHVYRQKYIQRNQDKRHELWRYAENKERVPQGWSWQPDVASYLRQIVPLTNIFAHTQERVKEQYMFPDGIFHFATLLACGDGTVIRFSVLPTLAPRLAIYFVEAIDRWLVRSVRAVGSQKPENAEQTSRIVRLYNRRPLPVSPAVRMYISER